MTEKAAASADTIDAASRGRMTLLLIAGIPVMMILASTWMWYYVASGKLDVVGALGTSNRGDLVQPPRYAVDRELKNPGGEVWAPGAPPRWSIVVPQAEASCAAGCEARLYRTRQIHQALGKELGRVQRLLVTNSDPRELQLAVPRLSDERPLPESFAAYLETEQRGLSVWQLGSSEFGNLFAEYLQQPDSWYLMDPNGWVMMRYDDSVTYKDIISDLKFLIRNSNG